MALLSVDSLDVEYAVPDGSVHAVSDVTFDLPPNEILGILGESGSGKSTLVRAICKDLPENGRVTNGTIRYNDTDINKHSTEALRELRWEEIAFVPQNAMNCLDPIETIGDQLGEVIEIHRDMRAREKRDRITDVLRTVGIDPARLNNYPHEMSGGMKQRLVLAMSLLLEPNLIIADEPTTGLDVLLRDKILADLETYRDEFGITVVIISHDIADLVETCDTLMVMYGGKIVETGPSRELIDTPTHPYTMGLKSALPLPGKTIDDIISMGMEPPDLRSPATKCIFAEQCPFKIPECTTSHPSYTRENGREVACYRADEAPNLRDSITTRGWSN